MGAIVRRARGNTNHIGIAKYNEELEAERKRLEEQNEHVWESRKSELDELKNDDKEYSAEELREMGLTEKDILYILGDRYPREEE